MVLSLQYLLWSIGVYGLVFWLPSIIRDSGVEDTLTVGMLSAVPYVVAVVAMVAWRFGASSSRDW